MSIEIKNLSYEVQQLCFLRQRQQGNKGDFTGDIGCGSNEGNFTWSETPEESYWQDLYDENDPEMPEASREELMRHLNVSLSYEIS